MNGRGRENTSFERAKPSRRRDGWRAREEEKVEDGDGEEGEAE